MRAKMYFNWFCILFNIGTRLISHCSFSRYLPARLCWSLLLWLPAEKFVVTVLWTQRNISCWIKAVEIVQDLFINRRYYTNPLLLSRCIILLNPLLRQKLPALPVCLGNTGWQAPVPGHPPPVKGSVHPPALVLSSEQVMGPVPFLGPLFEEVVCAVVNPLLVLEMTAQVTFSSLTVIKASAGEVSEDQGVDDEAEVVIDFDFWQFWQWWYQLIHNL